MTERYPINPRPPGTVAEPHAMAPPIDLGAIPTGEPMFLEYWRILKKRKKVVFLFLSVTVASVIVLALLSTTLYRGQVVLMIEPQAPQVLELQQVLTSSLGDDSYYETQYEILRSRSLASKIIEDLGLAADELEVPWWRALLGGASASPEAQTERRIDAYLDALSVDPARDTRLVRVGFSDPDPVQAARVANAHALAYIQQDLALLSRASHEAQALLEQRLEELEVRAQESQQVLNQFRMEHRIVSLGGDTNVVVEQLTDLNRQMTEVETQRITLEADYELSKRFAPDSLPAVLESSLVNTLKQSLAELEVEQAFLSTRFAPGYPRLAQLRAQVRESRRRLKEEVQTIVAGIETSYFAAKNAEEVLSARVEELKTRVLELNDASVELAMLSVENDTNRKLFENVRARIKEIGMAADLRASNIVIVERARTPVDSAGASKKLLLAAALVLGLLGGAGLALIIEFLDPRIRTPEELAQRIGLPSLGEVPDLFEAGESARRLELGGGAESRRSSGVAAAEGEGSLVAAESYRQIRTNILLSQAGEPPRTVLFTSAQESEGKTTTTANLGGTFAQLGGRVLVIDADLRKPSCHRMFGLPSSSGLTEVLAQNAALKGLIHEVGPDLFFLAGGKRPPNPTELLGSTLMRQLLEEARDVFDYVLIDGAPLLPVSDSVILATMVEGVVLVADQKTTQRHALNNAYGKLAHVGANVLGTVLNRAQVDRREYSYVLDWEPAP